MNNIINLTGRKITIYGADSLAQAPGGGRAPGPAHLGANARPLFSLESQGYVKPYSRVVREEVCGHEIVMQRYESVDNPAAMFPDCKRFIVSNLYASVARSLGIFDLELFTVYRLIKDASNSEELGCLGLEAK